MKTVKLLGQNIAKKLLEVGPGNDFLGGRGGRSRTTKAQATKPKMKK